MFELSCEGRGGMIEIRGNLWDYFNLPNHIIFITTNGAITKSNRAVMGRGCALEAKTRFPHLPKVLARLIEMNGNIVQELMTGLWVFPVKHSWEMDADLSLIKDSAEQLRRMAMIQSNITFTVPRPGCGNGRLSWEDVRPLLIDLPDNVRVITK
jgi:hypothetical protein